MVIPHLKGKHSHSGNQQSAEKGQGSQAESRSECWTHPFMLSSGQTLQCLAGRARATASGSAGNGLAGNTCPCTCGTKEPPTPCQHVQSTHNSLTMAEELSGEHKQKLLLDSESFIF